MVSLQKVTFAFLVIKKDWKTMLSSTGLIRLWFQGCCCESGIVLLHGGLLEITLQSHYIVDSMLDTDIKCFKSCLNSYCRPQQSFELLSIYKYLSVYLFVFNKLPNG